MLSSMRDHLAASHFALQAQVGDTSSVYRALSEVTSACVACHAGIVFDNTVNGLSSR